MILLATATPWEAQAVLRSVPLLPFYGEGMRRAWHGGYRTPSGRLVALLCGGMGPRAAAEALEEFQARSKGAVGGARVELALSCGFAGALQPDLRTGDLVADVRGLEASLGRTLHEAVKDQGLPFYFGPVAQSGRVLGPEEKRAFQGRAAAVDMESAQVRKWAELRGAGFLALRAILDEVEDSLPSGIPAKIGALNLARFAVKHAGEAPLLLATWGRQRKAGRRLGRGLRAFLDRL